MLNKRSLIKFFQKTPIGFFGSMFVVLLIIVAVFAPFFSLYDPIIQDYQIENICFSKRKLKQNQICAVKASRKIVGIQPDSYIGK